MRTVIIIPARYASTRYPGKPLATILGKPMILWVAELSSTAIGSENVYIATDDERILRVVEQAGYQAVLTTENALTGTDRVAQAAQLINADIYINVQGDEPLLNPLDIIKIRNKKITNLKKIINGYCWMGDHEDPNNVNIPKLITNDQNELVYVSRSALPAFKEIKYAPTRYKKQVCIYAYTLKELTKFHEYGRKSNLENSEDIEILRFFEMGKKICMVETSVGSLAVDEPEDIIKVENELIKKIMKNEE